MEWGEALSLLRVIAHPWEEGVGGKGPLGELGEPRTVTRDQA